VRRRELLAGAAGLAGAAALGAAAHGSARPPADPAQDLAGVLYGNPAAGPASLAVLRTAVQRARHDFQTARYDRLATTLPALIATASATRDEATSQQHSPASTLLPRAAGRRTRRPRRSPLPATSPPHDRRPPARQPGPFPARTTQLHPPHRTAPKLDHRRPRLTSRISLT
jgi:hypothetical protein